MADRPRTTASARRPTGRRPGSEPRPSALHRYLLDSEQLVFAVRRHAAVLAGAISIYVVVLFVAFLFLGFADGSGVIASTGLVVLLVGTLWFGWKVGDWWVERFTVTDRRVLLVSGLLTRRVAIMPLRKVTDLTFERTFAGRLFGYGAFVMESAGQQQALSRVDFLPRPESLYLQMSDLLFGRGGADHDPDEDGEDLRRPRGRGRGPTPRREAPVAAATPAAPASARGGDPRRRSLPTLRTPLVPPPPGATAQRLPTVEAASPSAAPPEPPPAPPPAPPSRPARPGPEGSATTPLPAIARDRAVARRPRGRHDPGPGPRADH